MQADGKRVLAGHAPRYKCVSPPHPHPTGRAAREAGAAVSAGRGIVDAFVTIGRQGGVSGLWKGVVPNCQRAGLVQLGDLTTYDAAKQRIMGLGEPPPRGLDQEESLLTPSVAWFRAEKVSRSNNERRAAGVEDGPVLHALSSAVAGLVAATMGTPADVIKTRVMNQPTDPQTGKGLLYKGSMDCLSRAVKEEGVRPNVRCSNKSFGCG